MLLGSQVMSETVACALEVLNREATQQTRLFIRMMDKFFDCLNVKSKKIGERKRKDFLKPYTTPLDERFEVSTNAAKEQVLMLFQ